MSILLYRGYGYLQAVSLEWLLVLGKGFLVFMEVRWGGGQICSLVAAVYTEF